LRYLGVILIVLISSMNIWAQRNCATDELEKQNKTPEQLQEQRDSFENWIEAKKLERFSTNSTKGLDETTIYTIPVVVHIIHRGEPIGVGTNIPDEQVFAQIEALNLDFRHLNADSVNTPPNFQPVMADIGFEFVLAKSDPQGFKTTGITRTKGNKEEWNWLTDNIELKALSYWDSDDFLNIWVAPLADSQLGWAEYPTTTIIPGVNSEARNNPLTDGVVVKTEAFGSENLYPNEEYDPRFNQGRTLTHEIGHFFGLRHIWGDGDCSVDDYVSDTPQTSYWYSNCPSPGTSLYSCYSEPSMFMNYMDYVNDECMNLFTIGQKDRMEIIINNSPRRASLLVSPGLLEPPPLDIAITSIVSPQFNICSSSITPQVEVFNNGTTTITSLTVDFRVNGVIILEKEFTLTLLAGQFTVLEFDNYAFTNLGLYQIEYNILGTNGGVDDNAANNQALLQVAYNAPVSALNEKFTNFPQSWQVRSNAPISYWNLTTAPNLSIDNTSAVLNYYNRAKQTDQLLLPFIDLTGVSDANFLFDYAYANREGRPDQLAVVLSTDCGINFTDTLFLKVGNELSNLSIPAKFTPSGRSDWNTVALDLTSYSNQNVQLAFVGSSQGGNNIYLDNFYLVDKSYEDIGIVGLLNESGAFDVNNDNIELVIANRGATTITNYTVDVKLDNVVVSTMSYPGTLNPMEEQLISIPNIFNQGLSNLTFEIVADDDQNVLNNQFSVTTNSLNNRIGIPFRENFVSAQFNQADIWTLRSPGDLNTWQFENGYLKLDAIAKGNKGLHDWLVLPMLDFSTANEAGLRYKVAYAENNFNNEVLRIWISTNGGRSFDYLVSDEAGLALATAVSDFEWSPFSNEDWQTKFIDLSNFAGEESVMIGFEAIDGDGNNIYLDDIELFVSGDDNLIEIPLDRMATYPNPLTSEYSKIAFNLTNKQDVRVSILDVRGQVISNQVFTNVLNQTYPLELGNQGNGIYFIHAAGSSFSNTMRVIVNR
jgi:archaellum component FlaF (FlaF/FlaG flagellin family)